MNKDKQEDKDMKTEEVDITEIREAIKILLSGFHLNLVETSKFEPTNIDIEISLYEEILFAARGAKKDLRKKRIWLFLAGIFLFIKADRIALKKQYKKLTNACKYICKHKKDLKNYVSFVKMGIIMDPNNSWIYTHYYSGDDVACRMRPDGRIERRFGQNPEYIEVKNGVFERAAEKREKRHFRNVCTSTEEEAFIKKGEEVVKIIQEEMSKPTCGPFKGQEEFRAKFKNIAENSVRKHTNVSAHSLSLKTHTMWLFMLNKAMREAWKVRLECTENSENSSIQKDDDSQS
jgi:hypothetical protein